MNSNNNFKKNQYLVVGFPRQGTDFFMSCLVESNKDLIYYREFFNPICTMSIYSSWIKTAFGSENSPDKLFYFNKKVLEKVYSKTWEKTNFNITKEVFSFTKVPFYQEHFELLSLFRHRMYTFPTTKPWFIIPIYDSFMRSELEGFNEVKSYFKLLKINDILKQTLIHTLCWFIQFHHIQNYNIKFLNYNNIIDMKQEELDIYLKNNMPGNLYNENISKVIIKNRNQNIKNIISEKYNRYKVEKECLKLIEILKQLNTGLREEYWQMLY